MRKLIGYIAILGIIFSYLSCEESGDISIDEESVFDFFFIDTLQLDISTIHIDSIVTEGASSLLLGKYEHPTLGEVEAKSFFQFSLGTFPTIESEYIFDSLGIIIYPYQNLYGKGENQTIEVYRINQDFEPEEDFFYQFDALTLEQEPLGQFTLAFEEDSDDSVFVKLSSALGQELFQMAIDGADDLDKDATFREFLQGFAFIPTDPEANFISSIPFDSDNIKLNMYYRISSEDDVDDFVYSFPIGTGNNQFNQVTAAGTDNLINDLISEELLTSSTSGVSYIQGASSLATKIRVPNIEQITTAFDIFTINYATLEISLLDKSYDEDTPFPQTLSLHYLSKFENIDQVLLTPIEGRTITGTLVIDEELGRFGHYEFDVGVYINDLIDNKGLNDESFYLTIPIDQVGSTINTIAIDASILETKLKIHISKYND